MRNPIAVLFTLVCVLLAAACESKKDEAFIGKVHDDTFTAGLFLDAALKSTPQIRDKHTKAWFAPSFTEYTQPSTGETTTQAEDALYFFLHFSCHSSDGSWNICPKYGIEVDDFANSPYGGQAGQLMGVLSMFSAKYDDTFRYAACEGQVQPHAPKFLGDTRYVIGTSADYLGLLTCTGVSTVPGSSEPTYITRSAGGTIEAFLHTQPKSANGAYVIQGYSRKAGGEIALFALNQTQYQPKDANCCQERTFLIGNIALNRFIFKRGTSADHGIVAFGTGGVDLGGALLEGHYAASVTEWAEHALYCVNNKSGDIEADGSACADETVAGFFAGTASWDDVATYLGLSAADKTYLAGWGAYFSDAGFMAAGDIPSSATQFPTGITFAAP